MDVILGAESLRSPLTGIGYYTQALLKGLSQDPRVHGLYGIQGSKIIDAASFLTDKEIVFTDSDKKKQLLRAAARSVPGTYRLRSFAVKMLAKRAMGQLSPDLIYHEPNYILRPFNGCSITTIHDLSHIHYPEYHPRERVSYLERELPDTLRKAAHIVTVSEFVRKEIMSVLGVESDKITAIPNGVGDEFYPRSRNDLLATLDNYDLKEGYILSVATLEPRKNLHSLLNVFMRLPAELKKRFPLVLVGGKGWHCSKLERQISLLEQTGQVRYLSYVSSRHLPHLYAAAGVFVFPSHYEGFGLPPLEAMASGVPVFASNNSAIAEVVADAGLLVDTRDEDQMLEALRSLLEDAGKRKILAERGIIRAKKFSWSICVDKTIDLYTRVADKWGVIRTGLQ